MEMRRTRACIYGSRRSPCSSAKRPIQVGIGGGNKGRVIAYFTRDSWSFFNLVGDPRAEGSSELVAGGQPGDFDRRHIVDAPTAISAVRKLIDDGTPTDHLWEEQDRRESKK